jgi:hypothetical protein
MVRWNPFHADWQGVLKDGWRSPQILLLIFAASIPIAFEPWMALINNFAVDEVHNFTGLERGILESVREIPGFLAFTVVYMLLIWRQQTFAILALTLMGLGVALTGMLPSVYGLYFTTLLMSTGFHFLATMEQSLAMQWASKEELPLVLGRMAAVAAGGSLVAYALVYVGFEFLDTPYWVVYMVAGALTLGLAGLCWIVFPKFKEDNFQTMTIVVRKRYWLYYALEFMSGGRRQIFVGFAAFLMVAEFGYDPAAVVALFAVNHVIAIWLAPDRHLRGLCLCRCRMARRSTLRRRPSVLCARHRDQELLPQDRRPRRHRFNGGCLIHDQPYCSSHHALDAGPDLGC